MLSVGQAESLLVQLPDGSLLLVDGGGYLYDTGHDFGRRVLAPALGALHVGRIDWIISTHDHPDHSGGLPYVISNFPIGEFWSGAYVSTGVREVLNHKKVLQRTMRAGDTMSLPGGVALTVLSPTVSGDSSGDDSESHVNEESLVFRLTYGAFSMLFCADAGFSAEQTMISGHRELRSTVLKVGHHGSRYSTSKMFLEQVRPELALISAGAGNRFGLPSTRTVDLLKSRGIITYRTDRDGSIVLITNGVTWSVATPHKPE
jgi:competence protein ComEC